MAFKPEYGTLAKITLALDIREFYEKSVGPSFNSAGYSYDWETAWQDGVVKACAKRASVGKSLEASKLDCTMLAKRIKREVVEKIPKTTPAGDSFRRGRDKDKVWRLIADILEQEEEIVVTTKANKYGLTEAQVEEITQRAIKAYERRDSPMCSDGHIKATEAVREALAGRNEIKRVNVSIEIVMEDGKKIHVSGPESGAWDYVEHPEGYPSKFTGNGAATPSLWIESLSKAIVATLKNYETSKVRINEALNA